MIATNILTTTDEFSKLEPEWRELWLRQVQTTPFQSPDWLLPWWLWFNEGRQLYVVTVRRDSKLTAVLPLYRQEHASLRYLVFVGTGNTDHLDAIVEPGDDESATKAVDALMEFREVWDEVDLQELPATSPLLRASSKPCIQSEAWVQGVCPMIALPESESIPLGSLKLRQWIATAKRRVNEIGALRRIDASVHDCLEVFDILVNLHRARWGTKKLPGVLDEPNTLGFHRDAIVRLCAAKVLRLFALEIAGKTVGAYYGFAHASVSYYYLAGFDPEFERVSVGSLLIAEAIRLARAERRATFDFLRGCEPYKYRWGATDRTNYRFRLRSKV